MKKALVGFAIMVASMTASAQFLNQEFINQAGEMAATGNMDSLRDPMQEEYQAESQRQIAIANHNFQEYDPRGISEKNRKIIDMLKATIRASSFPCDTKRYVETRRNGNMNNIKNIGDMREECRKQFPLK